MVPWVQLRTWHKALSFKGTTGRPELAHNMCHCLKGYLYLPYECLISEAEEDITAAIDEFLHM